MCERLQQITKRYQVCLFKPSQVFGAFSSSVPRVCKGGEWLAVPLLAQCGCHQTKSFEVATKRLAYRVIGCWHSVGLRVRGVHGDLFSTETGKYAQSRVPDLPAEPCRVNIGRLTGSDYSVQSCSRSSAAVLPLRGTAPPCGVFTSFTAGTRPYIWDLRAKNRFMEVTNV